MKTKAQPGSSGRSYRAVLRVEKMMIGRRVTAHAEYSNTWGWTVFGGSKIKLAKGQGRSASGKTTSRAATNRLPLVQVPGGYRYQFDGKRNAFMDREDAAHAFLQIGLQVAHGVDVDDELVVVFRVHEVEAFAVLIEELVVHVFNERALNLFGRTPAFRHLHAIDDAAHVDLGDRRTLARVEVFSRQHDIELAVHIDDIALAHGRGDNLDHWNSLYLRKTRRKGRRSRRTSLNFSGAPNPNSAK